MGQSESTEKDKKDPKRRADKLQRSRHNTILYNLTQPEKERYEKLFKEIDLDNNGSISLEEMGEVYKRRGIKNNMRWAKDVFDRYGAKKIDLSTFILIAVDQEAELRKSFKKMDMNNTAEIDAEDLRASLAAQNIEISPQQAELLLKKIDKNASGTISFEEWSDYFLFTNSTSISHLMKFWETSRRPGHVLSKADYSTEELKHHILEKSFLAGGASAVISRTCVAPLDRVKIKWQVEGIKTQGAITILRDILQKEGWENIKSVIKGDKKSITSFKKKNYFNQLVDQNIFVEVKRTLTKMRKIEGVKAWYNGNVLNCMKGAPSASLRYYIYERINKHVLVKYESSGFLDTMSRAVVGGVAGALAQSIVYPFDVMKTRMNLMKAREYRSIADCAAHIIAERGPMGFYRGSMVNVFGVMLYSGLDIVLYENSRNYIYENMAHDLEKWGLFFPIVFGTLVNACVASLTYPFATIKTRLQASIQMNLYRDASLRNIAHIIFQNEGYRGFYQGLGVNLLKSVPATFVSIMTFEAIMLAFPWQLLFKNTETKNTSGQYDD